MPERWEYITLRSREKSGTAWFDNQWEIAGDGYTFEAPDAALKALGIEGWECILYHRDDGPRQQVIPKSLIQPPPWPVKYELVFKRKAP